jgi:hypothetical protein
MDQINPFAHNFQMANQFAQQSSLLDQLRQKALEAQTVQNTQFDTNRSNRLIAGMNNLDKFAGTMGRDSTTAMIPALTGVNIPHGAHGPGSFPLNMDGLQLQEGQQKVIGLMAGILNDGLDIDPVTGDTRIVTNTQKERIEQIRAEAEANKLAAMYAPTYKTTTTQRDPNTLAQKTYETEQKGMPNANNSVQLPVRGINYNSDTNEIISEQPESAPMSQQGQVSDTPKMQEQRQEAERLIFASGGKMVNAPIRLSNGSYLYQVQQRDGQIIEIFVDENGIRTWGK